MKIGMITYPSVIVSDNLNHVFGNTVGALRQKHEIIFCPPEYIHTTKARQRELLKDLLLASDVLLGPIDDLTLQVRAGIDKQPRFICFLHGNMSRGAPFMIRNYHYFKSTDILIGNCTADVTLARKFFNNAQIRLLPFAFDESVFYPLEDAHRQAIKAKLGFGPEEKILLYSGRITVEKNVHTIMRIFSVVQKLIPSARLILAGNEFNSPFAEFGVLTVGIKRSLTRVIAKLGIDEGRVSFIGQKSPGELRDLYNIADAVVNMTLHHDENFGLAQVEAMACGTPVIGTNWGGLKDTIVDGETGYKVSTVVTTSGVKVNWWEAINRIVGLLTSGPEYLQLRQRCRSSANERFSLVRYRQNLESILADCLGKAEGSGEPLKASAFARQYWRLCAPQWGERPSYRRSELSYEMYRELITPFAGLSSNGSTAGSELDPDQVLCLASPILLTDKQSVVINDPIFPFEIALPDNLKEAIRAIAEIMKKEPAITVGRLIKTSSATQQDVLSAMEWMFDTGLIVKNEPESWAIAPQSIGCQMATPLFSIQGIDHSTDIIFIN